MRKPRYDVNALKSFLEEKIGEKLAAFEMITDCSRPQNFRVVTASGERLAVKCVPPEKTKIKYFEHFMKHLEELKGTRAVQIAYGPWKFGDCTVVALAWAGGRRIMPERLPPELLDEVIAAYTEFSRDLQKATMILPERDNLAVRREVMENLEGFGCKGLREFLDTEFPPESMAYDKTRLRVIHGDFHHGNFNFENGRITGFMDLEDCRWGYPADDWMRYVICAAEHLKWFDFAGRRRLLAIFADKLLPLAPADEWREAIAGLLIRKFDRRFVVKPKGPRWWLALNMRFRIGFYRRLVEIVDSAEDAK